MTARILNAGRPTAARAPLDGPRYLIEPSRLVAGQWVLVDRKSGQCWRGTTRTIHRFDTEQEAIFTAHRLNTARLICVVCRHKAPAADCVNKVCPTCQQPDQR